MIEFAHKTRGASCQIYENLHCKLFFIVNYFDNVKGDVIVVVGGIIITIVKEVVVALVSQINTKEIVLFSPKKKAKKELVGIDWLDYDNITQEAMKYTPGDNDSHETFEDIGAFPKLILCL